MRQVSPNFDALMNTNELWQAALGEMELKLSKANFTTWFKSTFIAQFEDGELAVAVPNAFTKTWLEKKYHKDILTSLQNITGGGIKAIIYRVETRAPEAQQIYISHDQGSEEETPVAFTNEPSFTQSQGQSSHDSTDSPLNPKHTFATFVVGKHSDMAHAASQAVAAQPGTIYNPLFVYGGVGLGKTHLLHAIGNEVIRHTPNARILYVSCERFTNEFISSVRNGLAHEFKDRYRNVDVLLIDDIQFITSKERTQEEFFHTFNALKERSKQIVISSDRPPKAIPALENRLLSRFESGLMADVGAPDVETRMAILESKCSEKSYPLNRDLLYYIATAIQSNVRELEGALTKVIAYHQFKNVEPTIESIMPILTSYQPASIKKNVTPRQLIQTVAAYFDLEVEGLLGKSREKRLAFPRQIIMYLMRDEMKSSYPSIGAELGGRDHTTAMHAHDKITHAVQIDEKLQRDLELIKQRLFSL